MVGLMAVPGEVRSPEKVLDTLARVTDGFFRDPDTGRVTLYAEPNVKIKLVGAIVGVSHALQAAHVTRPGSPLDVNLERAAMAALLWWSGDQLLHGTTLYLKSIGAVTLVGALMRTVVAERARLVPPA